jgi:hypothetical protein
MTDRDRLIELIQNAVNGCARHWAEIIADYLLANGVIVPPCKVGDIVYTLCGERYFDNNGVEWERLSGKQHIEERQFSLGMMDENYNLCSCYFLTKEEAEEKLKEREGK